MATSKMLAEGMLRNAQARRAMSLNEKYLRVAESVKKAQGKELTLESKVALAKTLKNTRELLEATNSSNIPSKTFFMDMLTAVVPNLIASDIVSTQALEDKTGIISYLRFTYGTDKGAVQAGQMFNNSLYTGKSDPYYTSGLVTDEAVQSGASLDFTPIIPGKVVIVNQNDVKFVDDGNGNLINPATSATIGTIDYATGAIAATTASDIDFGSIATYNYNNEQVPDLKVPEMNMDLAQIPIIAGSRKLAAYWGFDAAYDLKKQYGAEILDVMSAQAAGEIAHKQLVA